MNVDDALIEKLSRLAMLSIDGGEKEKIRQDLEKMIGFVDKLKELDTSGVPPLVHLRTDSLDRPDLPGAMLSREEALKNAPRHDGQYFRVPQTISKTES